MWDVDVGGGGDDVYCVVFFYEYGGEVEGFDVVC